MSNCSKGLFDYNLVKDCSKCGIISLKKNCHKWTLFKDGLYNQCKVCRKEYYHENFVKIKKKF